MLQIEYFYITVSNNKILIKTYLMEKVNLHSQDFKKYFDGKIIPKWNAFISNDTVSYREFLFKPFPQFRHDRPILIVMHVMRAMTTIAFTDMGIKRIRHDTVSFWREMQFIYISLNISGIWCKRPKVLTFNWQLNFVRRCVKLLDYICQKIVNT